MRRRMVLASIVTLPALSGCLSSDDGGSADGGGSDGGDASVGEGGDDGGSTGGDGGSGGPLAAASPLGGYPSLGAEPSTADRLIVAFEDPGCPNCARFHANDLPGVRSQVLDGATALVWRPLRYATRTSPWNADAMHATLEATEQSNDAAWTLLDYYYANQSSLTTGNVADRTRTALADEPSVDADAVVAAMAEGAHSDLLGESEADARAASVTSTPSFVLFDGGSHVTTIRSSASAAELSASFDA